MSNRNRYGALTSRSVLESDEELRRSLLGDDQGPLPAGFAIPADVTLPEYAPADAALDTLPPDWLPPPDLSHRDSPARLRDVDTHGGLPPGAPRPDLSNLEPGPAPQSGGSGISEGRMSKILQSLAAAGTASKLPDSFYAPVLDTAAADERRRQAGEMHTARLGDIKSRTEIARMAAVNAQQARAAARDRDDPASPGSQAAREAFEAAAKASPDWLERFRPMLNTYSEAQITKTLLPLLKDHEKATYEAARHTADRAARERIAQRLANARSQNVDDKEARDDLKHERRLAELDRKQQITDVRDLSKALGDLPAMRNNMEILADIANEEDIPGVGLIAGRMPNFAKSERGQLATQAALSIMAAYMKQTSGAAVSEPEAKRLLAARGINPAGSESEFRLGVRRLLTEIRDAARATEARADPRALELARQRGVVTSDDLPQWSGQPGTPITRGGGQRSAPTATQRPASGKVRVSNGRETLLIDSADISDARRDGYTPVGE